MRCDASILASYVPCIPLSFFLLFRRREKQVDWLGQRARLARCYSPVQSSPVQTESWGEGGEERRGAGIIALANLPNFSSFTPQLDDCSMDGQG